MIGVTATGGTCYLTAYQEEAVRALLGLPGSWSTRAAQVLVSRTAGVEKASVVLTAAAVERGRQGWALAAAERKVAEAWGVEFPAGSGRLAEFGGRPVVFHGPKV